MLYENFGENVIKKRH